ncbi:MAG TPA: Gfo/Idh/MocA family oxidoreductase [Acidobacteriota bacterium]|jgi:predicted dehydrogenase
MKTKSTTTRRLFLGRAAGGVAALELTTSSSFGSLLAANERIGVALIGSGGRGRVLAKHFRQAGADLRAICDVYEPNLRAGLSLADTGAKSYVDFREVVNNQDIDAVIVATPDHWHAQMIIDAVSAGKDVYVEKPMCHLAEEGFGVIDAVKKSGRIVQVGTQRRSYSIFIEGKRIVDSNQLGRVHLVTSGWFNRQGDALVDRSLRGKLDWAGWLGPAPQRPLDPKRFFNWYHFWDYSGGLTVGQGAHMLDAIGWFMDSTYPAAVTCIGTKPHTQGAEVPETTTITVEYPEDFIATFSLGYKAMRYAPVNDQLLQLHGSTARLDMGRESLALYPEGDVPAELKPAHYRREIGAFEQATSDHVRNFLDCVRSRKKPNAPVEAGHHTSVILAMAMHSLRHSGQRVRWNGKKRQMEI